MRNVYGNVLTLTLFGESHGPSVGAVLDGLAPGIPVDETLIRRKLTQRRPQGAQSTARVEADEYVIESGVYRGFTTGSPLCIRIPNTDAHSRDYDALAGKARPGHCDYPAFCRYRGFEDARGGGHFSGRVTAALVAAGAVVTGALTRKGIRIATHLSRCAGVNDRAFDYNDLSADMDRLDEVLFPALDESAGARMIGAILAAKADGDSVGGVLETVVTGLPAGIGEPWFDTVEGALSRGLFSVPAVKGVEFGDGFALADGRGSLTNDAYRAENGVISTVTNHCGGVCGGLTTGMPLVFRCAVKPTPSIGKEQETVDFLHGDNVKLTIPGRHDPCVAHRARAVVDAVTALTIADLLTVRYGADRLSGGAE